jgi:hypothetical protein
MVIQGLLYEDLKSLLHSKPIGELKSLFHSKLILELKSLFHSNQIEKISHQGFLDNAW